MDADVPTGPPLNVLLLYDANVVYTNTVREHVGSFRQFSRHRITYAPAAKNSPLTFSLDPFDAVVLHYSIRLAFEWHLSPEFAFALKKFKGLKVAFLQDEYDHTWRACQWINQLGVRLVFTCVPQEHVRTVYGRVGPATTFVTTLTGFLPIDGDLSKHVRPLADRPVAIGYRGRELPFRYGRLGREKLKIGVRMRAECEARGVRHDIEWTEAKRIYGPAWVDFIASCRATLGTESGSNVFDFDGTLSTDIAAALKADPRLTYEQVEERFLQGRELDGVMNQVSPRIFEAVALRTGLVLFEGTYSGVVQADEHFIPLKKDFSNVDEVIRRVLDDRELSAITERAFRDVIGSGKYTYEAFVRGFDAELSRLAGPGRGTVVAAGSSQLAAYAPPKPALKARVRAIPIVGIVAYGAYHAARGVYIGLGLQALRKAWKRRRGAAAMITAISGLAESPLPRREIVRLAHLRHACHDCPTIRAPIWTTIQYDETAGRLEFVSRPIHDLPGEVQPGNEVLEQAVAGIRARRVREVTWDFRAANPIMFVNLGKLGVVDFDLRPVGTFRFTALGRLADQDPERAAQLLAAAADGVSVLTDEDGATATPTGRG